MMFPYQFQLSYCNPPFIGNNGALYPSYNGNGNNQHAQNFPQIMNGQQQGKAYCFPNQWTPCISNTAMYGNNGGLGTHCNGYLNNHPTQNCLQMNSGQQQSPQNHVNNTTSLNTTWNFENGSLCMAKLATDAAISSMERLEPNGKCSFKMKASKDGYEISYDQNQNN